MASTGDLMHFHRNKLGASKAGRRGHKIGKRFFWVLV
jgi:hypothetical protein